MMEDTQASEESKEWPGRRWLIYERTTNPESLLRRTYPADRGAACCRKLADRGEDERQNGRSMIFRP